MSIYKWEDGVIHKNDCRYLNAEVTNFPEYREYMFGKQDPGTELVTVSIGEFGRGGDILMAFQRWGEKDNKVIDMCFIKVFGTEAYPFNSIWPRTDVEGAFYLKLYDAKYHFASSNWIHLMSVSFQLIPNSELML